MSAIRPYQEQTMQGDIGQLRADVRRLMTENANMRQPKSELARARALMADIFYALSEPVR